MPLLDQIIGGGVGQLFKDVVGTFKLSAEDKAKFQATIDETRRRSSSRKSHSKEKRRTHSRARQKRQATISALMQLLAISSRVERARVSST